MAEFTIPDADIQAMLSTRLIDALSADTREKLIGEALKYLISPPKDRGYYGDKKTPIQSAFDAALVRMANQVVDEVCSEGGIGEKIKAMFVKMIEDLPDFYSDNELQLKILQVTLNRANEVRLQNARD